MAGPTGVNARTSDGVFPSLGSIQSASYLKAGSVVKNYQDKLDYFISETDEGSNIPISGTNPQLYANPEVTTPGTGETNTASNIGIGDGPFAQKVASDLQFNSEKYNHGIESQLIDNTYYRGLNPFIAESIGAFTGNLVSSRTTATTVTSKSGVLLECPADRVAYGKGGLSCFGSVTNKFIQSEAFDDVAWSKSATNIDPNSVTSPRLDVVADSLIEDSANSQHFISQSVSFTAGKTYTLSIFAKKDTRNVIQLIFPGGGFASGYANFDLDAGVVSASNNVTPEIEKLVNGWYRCSIRDVAIASTSAPPFYVLQDSPTSARFAAYMGDGSSRLSIFGAQVDEGEVVYPYTKSLGSMTVKGLDINSNKMLDNMPINGLPFCIVFDVAVPILSTNCYVISFGPQSLATIYLRRNSSDNRITFFIRTESGAHEVEATLIDGSEHRFIISYDSVNMYLDIDGVQIDSEAVIDLPSYDVTGDIYIGSLSSGSQNLQGSVIIKKWIVGKTLTPQQRIDLGGPDNVIL